MYFSTYALRKTWLEQCLKVPLSEDPATSNMVKGLKHCSKLNDSDLTIFLDACGDNSVRKSIF